MTNIKQVVASLLCDIVQAQHEANAYAQRLMEQDRASGLASISPAVSLGELSITLSYAVTSGVDATQVTELNPTRSATLLRRLSEQLAHLIIRKVVQQVQTSPVDYRANGFSFVDDLGDNTLIIDYTAQRMLASLRDNLSKIAGPQGTFDVEAIADQVLGVGDQYVLRHSDLVGLFSLQGGAELLLRIKQELDLDVSESIRQILDEVTTADYFDSREEQSLRIEIDADRLKEYATSALQSLTLRVMPSGTPS